MSYLIEAALLVVFIAGMVHSYKKGITEGVVRALSYLEENKFVGVEDGEYQKFPTRTLRSSGGEKSAKVVRESKD